MQAPTPLLRILSEEVLPSTHPVDPILKHIVAQCVDESQSLDEATHMITQAFAAVSERIDVVQAMIVNAMSMMGERR